MVESFRRSQALLGHKDCEALSIQLLKDTVKKGGSDAPYTVWFGHYLDYLLGDVNVSSDYHLDSIEQVSHVLIGDSDNFLKTVSSI